MKKEIAAYLQLLRCVLLLVGTSSILTSAHGQNRLTKFLSADNSKYAFFIDLKDSEGIVFVLQEWMDKGLGGYILSFSDTLQRQPVNAAYLYVGKTTKIQREGNSPRLFFSEGNAKPEKLRVDTAYIQGDVLFKINNAYWWSSIFRLSENLNAKFPLYHYSFRNGLGLWERFKNKEGHYESFKIFADKKIKAIRDSITTVEAINTSIVNDVRANISTMPYSTLKEYIVKLPVEFESEYFTVVVGVICMNRPEWFFKLADDLPQKKQQLFDAVDTNRSTLKKLSDTKINSPAKKQFFRED